MRARILLLLGCIIGAALAASGLLENKSVLALSEDSVATVNGVSIPKAQFLSIVNAIEKEKKAGLGQNDYQYILQKLVDEELMVQRGQELGLLQLNSTIRNNMRIALIESVLAEHAHEQPQQDELRTFYESDKAFFSRPEKVRVRLLSFADEKQAQSAKADLDAGYDFEVVKQAYAMDDVIELPDAWLGLRELQNYLGPSLTRQISEMNSLGHSDVLAVEQRWYLVHLIDVQKGEAPAFETIEEAVKAEFIRRKNGKLIEDYIRFLRDAADIQYAPIDPVSASVQ